MVLQGLVLLQPLAPPPRHRRAHARALRPYHNVFRQGDHERSAEPATFRMELELMESAAEVSTSSVVHQDQGYGTDAVSAHVDVYEGIMIGFSLLVLLMAITMVLMRQRYTRSKQRNEKTPPSNNHTFLQHNDIV